MSMNENLMTYYKDEKMVQSSMKLSLYSCQFLLMMLDQIRELSNMRLKSLELDLEVFDLRERLNTLFENTIIQAELKSLKMIIQID
jgi:hypothetical protein